MTIPDVISQAAVVTVSGTVYQAATLGVTAFVGAVGNDFFGRKCELVHQVPKVIQAHPVKEGSRFESFHKVVNYMNVSGMQECFFREESSQEAKTGAVLLGSVTAVGLGVFLLGCSPYIAVSVLALETLGLMGSEVSGNCVRTAVASSSDIVSKGVSQVYSKAFKLVDKDVFDQTIIDSQEVLKKLGYSPVKVKQVSAKDLREAKNETENQLCILTRKLSLGLTIGLMHSYILGDVDLSVRDGILKEENQDNLFRISVNEDPAIRDLDRKSILEKLDFREKERGVLLEEEQQDEILVTTTEEDLLMSDSKKAEIFKEIFNRKKDRNEILQKQELNAILQEVEVSKKKGVSLDSSAVYLKRNGDNLTRWQAVSMRVWFFVAQGFISNLVEKFAVNILNEFRKDFISEDGSNQENLVNNLIARLTEMFNLKSASTSSGLSLKDSCDELIDKIVDQCMPKLLYFESLYDIAFIGKLFIVIDEIIINVLNYFWGFEDVVKTACKDSGSVEVSKMISELLKPENMRPHLIKGLKSIEESVKTTEDLEEPLPDDPKVQHVKDLLGQCLESLYLWLKIPDKVPALKEKEVKDYVIKFSTEQLFKALSQRGAPIEVEGYLCKLLESVNKESSTLKSPSLTEEEFDLQIKQSLGSLKESSANVVAYGDPQTVEYFSKIAREKQSKMIRDHLCRLECVRNDRRSHEESSNEEIIASLKKEVGILGSLFQEARSFSLKIGHSLPESYQERLRQDFMPIYENMKEQVVVLEGLLDHLEGEGLERSKNHKVIRELLGSANKTKVGASFRSSLSTSVGKICRKGTEEDLILSKVSMTEEDLDKDKAGIALKTILLSMVERQRLEYVRIRCNLEEKQENLFSDAKKLAKQVHMIVLQDGDMKPRRTLDVRAAQEAKRWFINNIEILLSKSEEEALTKKISDFSLTNESHTELASILVQEIAKKILKH